LPRKTLPQPHVLELPLQEMHTRLMTDLNRAVGFNIVAYMSGNLGLGVVARQVAAIILSKNLPLTVFDLDAGVERGRHDLSFRDYGVSSPDDLLHGITLFVLPPQTIFGLAQDPKYRPLLLRREGIQAALLMWEHSRLPRRWRPALRIFDVIVAVSPFIRAACDTSLDGVLTIAGLLPLRLPEVAPCRERFQLPSGPVIFVTSFEAYGADRKNPLAAVEAFRRAFPDDRRAMLVIKINNPISGGTAHPIVLRLRHECAKDSRLRLFEESLSYRDVLALYASCDAFISLHRSEGLGLGLMEAMAIGKPVIATAWSGNMAFMNATNSCPVPCKLVPVKTTLDVYAKHLLGHGALWAEPDIDDAAAWMTRLAAEPGLRSTIGLRAAQSMAAREHEADRAAFLGELAALHEHLPTMPSFRSKKLRLSEVERWLLRADRRRAARANVKRLLDRYVLWRLRRWSRRP
jgi:glycosyltransferase involved in cell wall biosynthesis